MGAEDLRMSPSSIQSRSPIFMTKRLPAACNKPVVDKEDGCPNEGGATAESEMITSSSSGRMSVVKPASPIKLNQWQVSSSNQQRWGRCVWNCILCGALGACVVLLTILSTSEDVVMMEDRMRMLPGKTRRMEMVMQKSWRARMRLKEEELDGRFHTGASGLSARTLSFSITNHKNQQQPQEEKEGIHTPTTTTTTILHLHHPPKPKSFLQLWSLLPYFHNNYRQCIQIEPLANRLPSETNGYVVVTANGGLNQMRNGICDMVAIAMIMNATLVVPQLDHNSFWKDTSEFGDIFDVNHFISTLEQYVPVVEKLPDELATKDQVWRAPVSWSESSYYTEDILPILKEHGVVHFSHTDSRLANNDLPTSMQQLRCYACYKALKYKAHIEDLATRLVDRMKRGGRRYVALHLRYEKDMLAFTGCSHGFNETEAMELQEMRYNVQHWKEKEIDGEQRRIEGGCPLTPHEVALTLRGLGFDGVHTQVYVVAGPLFGGDSSLEPLRRHFPLLFTHMNLASKTEIAPLLPFANQLAALDYLIALRSDVFFHSFDGNMARALQGHRRFLGHLTTITPHRKGVIKLVDELGNGTISWTSFEKKVKHLHRKRMGAPRWRHKGDSPKSEENFYANPYPGCVCETATTF